MGNMPVLISLYVQMLIIVQIQVYFIYGHKQFSGGLMPLQKMS